MIGEGKRLKVKGERAVVSGQLPVVSCRGDACVARIDHHPVVGAHGCAPTSDTGLPACWLIWTKNIGVWLVVVGLIGLMQAMILLSKDFDLAAEMPAIDSWIWLVFLLGTPLGGLLVLISAYPGSQAWHVSWVRKPGMLARIFYVLAWIGVSAITVQLLAPVLIPVTVTADPTQLGFSRFVSQALTATALIGMIVVFLFIASLVKQELMFPPEAEARRIIDQGGFKVHWTAYATAAFLVVGLITGTLVERFQVQSLMLRTLAWTFLVIGLAGTALLLNPFVKQFIPQLERIRKHVGYMVLYPLAIAWITLNGFYLVYGGERLESAVVLMLGLSLAAAVGLHIESAVRSRAGAALALPTSNRESSHGEGEE